MSRLQIKFSPSHAEIGDWFSAVNRISGRFFLCLCVCAIGSEQCETSSGLRHRSERERVVLAKRRDARAARVARNVARDGSKGAGCARTHGGTLPKNSWANQSIQLTPVGSRS